MCGGENRVSLDPRSHDGRHSIGQPETVFGDGRVQTSLHDYQIGMQVHKGQGLPCANLYSDMEPLSTHFLDSLEAS
jgi:hypothetical protein